MVFSSHSTFLSFQLWENLKHVFGSAGGTVAQTDLRVSPPFGSVREWRWGWDWVETWMIFGCSQIWRERRVAKEESHIRLLKYYCALTFFIFHSVNCHLPSRPMLLLLHLRFLFSVSLLLHCASNLGFHINLGFIFLTTGFQLFKKKLHYFVSSCTPLYSYIILII